MTWNIDELINGINSLLSTEPSLGLRKISFLLGVERHTLERAVHSRKGMCFREYKQKLKLEQAVSLLAQDPNRSCRLVAKSLGFGSSAAFSRFIKTLTGHTPSEIRRSCVVGSLERESLPLHNLDAAI